MESEGAGYVRVPVQFSMDSDILQFKDMIYQIETSSRLLVVSELDIRQLRSRDGYRIRSVVTVEGVMETPYYRIKRRTGKRILQCFQIQKSGSSTGCWRHCAGGGLHKNMGRLARATRSSRCKWSRGSHKIRRPCGKTRAPEKRLENDAQCAEIVDQNLFSADRACAPTSGTRGRRGTGTREGGSGSRISEKWCSTVVMLDDYKKALTNDPADRTVQTRAGSSEGDKIGNLVVEIAQDNIVLTEFRKDLSGAVV
ncbi:MAG: hypothetical protein R2860_07395 [Desulfobacterales bacterium]